MIIPIIPPALSCLKKYINDPVNMIAILKPISVNSPTKLVLDPSVNILSPIDAKTVIVPPTGPVKNDPRSMNKL